MQNVQEVSTRAQFTSYITSKVRITRARTNGRSFYKYQEIIYKSGVKSEDLTEFEKKATHVMIFLPHLCGRKLISALNIEPQRKYVKCNLALFMCRHLVF